MLIWKTSKIRLPPLALPGVERHITAEHCDGLVRVRIRDVHQGGIIQVAGIKSKVGGMVVDVFDWVYLIE